MIRFIISLTRLIVVAVVVTIFTSCNSGRDHFLGETLTGSGNVVSLNREVSQAFTGIDVSSGLDVVVIQDPQTSIVVEADDNIQDAIVTKVENGVLIIRTSRVSLLRFKKATVTVKTPTISSIESSSGSRVRSGNTIISERLMVRSSSGSKLTVDTEANELIAESSSGSSIKLRGKALTLETSSSSGSSNDASDLVANNVESQSSSGSSTRVKALLSLDASASSGSSIRYSGEPKSVNRSESSGGSVSM